MQKSLVNKGTTKPNNSTVLAKIINFKCIIDGEAKSAEYMGSTVERMLATPPSSPPGRRKTAAVEPLLTDKILNGVVQRMSDDNETLKDIQNARFCKPDDYLQLSNYNQPAIHTLQPSTSSSIMPSSALTVSTTNASSSNVNTMPQQPGTPTALSETKALMQTDLLQWQDMPQYLQFNPYVLKGYRPLQTFKGCLYSLFYWHNETVNILTHAIPIVYILAIVPGLMPWDKGYKFLSFCHLFGSVAPWCGSFVYHLFMNIEKGETVYYTLLKLDMVGIWVSQSFGALPLVTATTLCFGQISKWFVIISYCLLSLWGLYKALTATSPWQRRLCFALPFTMRSILTCLRIRGLVGGSHMALSHVYLQDGVSILGGAIGAMRIPEKWFPGLVDFYLNSHNIMHVLVVIAVYSMHKATLKDFEWMSTQTCNTYGNTTENSVSSSLNQQIEL